MTINPSPSTDGTVTGSSGEAVSWTDLGKEMWNYLTGQGAAINYTFVDMKVEVPRDTGADAPRATWKLDGTLRITTEDDTHSPGAGG
ncbi:hypothetical protein [Ornithinimicrobium cerasi]|uniref:hypothetical protein n=1 Tax=Ornithinimicrobium cerasi TaxID=2248773 RepID=UPI000F0026CC|nr:hypothetical protein [Ornithinimicrobium cerasi]